MVRIRASADPARFSATPDPPQPGHGRDAIALVLAIGLAAALVIIVGAVMYDAIRSDTPGLSENATQILTGWGGGIIGVVGSYLGYRTGEATRAGRAPDTPPAVDDPPD